MSGSELTRSTTSELVSSEKRRPAELVAFKSLLSGKSWLTEQSGRLGWHCAGGSMIAFSLSRARGIPRRRPQQRSASRKASKVERSVGDRYHCEIAHIRGKPHYSILRSCVRPTSLRPPTQAGGARSGGRMRRRCGCRTRLNLRRIQPIREYAFGPTITPKVPTLETETLDAIVLRERTGQTARKPPRCPQPRTRTRAPLLLPCTVSCRKTRHRGRWA